MTDELKTTLRLMALERTGPFQLIEVLNDPTKQIAIPVAYRDSVFTKYEIKVDQLVGDAPLHAIFVREGLAIKIVHLHEGLPRLILHGIDLREDSEIEEVGAEIYRLWKAFPRSKLLTYSRLQRHMLEEFQRQAKKS